MLYYYRLVSEYIKTNENSALQKTLYLSLVIVYQEPSSSTVIKSRSMGNQQISCEELFKEDFHIASCR